MNANTKNKIIIVIAGLLVLTLASCNSPTSPRVSIDAPSTGVDSDPVTGLIAGIPMEGDAILNHPDVIVADTVTWETGISGNAMRGDEDGDYFRITDGALPETLYEGSVEVWIYPEAPDGEDNKWAGILHKGELISFIDEAWSIQYQGAEKAMFNYHYDLDGANKYKSVTASDKLSDGAWHHITVTWFCDVETGDVTLNLYLDGMLDVTMPFPGIGPMIDSDGDLIVGSQLPEQYNPSYGHLTFMGLIDEVSVYDHVRSADEILSAYEALLPTP